MGETMWRLMWRTMIDGPPVFCVHEALSDMTSQIRFSEQQPLNFNKKRQDGRNIVKSF